MTAAPDLTGWWEALRERLPGTAVAAGVTSPRQGVRHWSAGELSQQPATDSTTFYAASVTKQLIAALVARAVLDGHLDRQAGVATLLPELPAWTAPIRVHHLLHHTAALPQPPRLAVALGHPEDPSGWSRMDNEAVLVALHHVAPPTVPPGQEFTYDNTGYILLAELLQAVCDGDVADLAQSKLFGPLGMAGSRLGGPAPVMLPGHTAPPATVGDGGLWTCAPDLLTGLEAINQDRLGADLTRLVQSPGRLEDGTVLDYAWGIGPRPGPAGSIYLHGGEWPGWCAMTVRSPATGTAVVILAATEDMSTASAAALRLHEQLVSAVLEQLQDRPAQPQHYPPPSR